MGARFRSWWQKTEKPAEILGIIMALIAGIVLIYVVVHFNGTGFDGYNQTSISTDITPPPHKITRTEVYQPGKTLWDWLQLLIIPLVLAVGGYVFNLTVSRNEQKSTQVRDQTEREIASDNQQEAALQAYIDKMSELLLNSKLRESAEDAEVRKIARVRTLTVLPRLDKVRKKSVLQFLYEAGLLDKDKHIVDLRGANLSLTNLSITDLSGAYLVEANLGRAELGRADLSEANNLTTEQLDKAKSLQGAVMPDGTIHS